MDLWRFVVNLFTNVFCTRPECMEDVFVCSLLFMYKILTYIPI